MSNQFELTVLLAAAAAEATSALWALAREVPPATTLEEAAKTTGLPIEILKAAFKNVDAELNLQIGDDIEKMVVEMLDQAKTEAEKEVESEKTHLKEVFEKWSVEVKEIIERGRNLDPMTSNFYDQIEKVNTNLQRDIRAAMLVAHVSRLAAIFHARFVNNETARKIAEVMAVRD